MILYCASGLRAALAGKILKDMGYAEVYNLGAFKDWAESGGSVERFEKKKKKKKKKKTFFPPPTTLGICRISSLSKKSKGPITSITNSDSQRAADH